MNSGKPSCRARFGPYELNPEEHMLRKNGIAIRLQEQPWQVLCALLEKPGAVVTREELRKRLWPEGTFVDFEQSLNKAVNKLREALLDSADKARYIETLARQGYRFVAEVEVETAAEPEPAAAPRAAKRRQWGWSAGLAGLVGLVLVTGLWQPPVPKTRVTALTSGPRDKGPGLVVTGGRVLYSAAELGMRSARFELWSVPAAGGDARREPSPCPPEGWGAAPASVSYLRRRLVLGCSPAAFNLELWLAGLDGSSPKRMGQFQLLTQTVSVSPDLGTFLFGRKEGLFARPVEGGQERLLARVDGIDLRITEPLAPPPVYHPDGGRIVCQRTVNGTLKLWEVDSDGTGLRPVLPRFEPEQHDAQWSPDGRRLYFVSNGDIYLHRRRAWLGWMRPPVPVRLTTGPVQFEFPREDPDDRNAAYAVGRVVQVEALKLNRKTNVWEPFLGGLAADRIDFARDTASAAYVSWPDGRLWKCRMDGSGKVLLEDGLFCIGPQWSPDGTRIAFSGQSRSAAGKITQPFRIYTIAAGGGKAEPVPGVPGPAFDPTWSPDGKRLAFAPLLGQGTQEQRHISIVNLESGAVETVPGSDNLFSVRYSPDGRYLAALTCDRIWPVIYSFATKQWTPLLSAHVGFPHWSNDSHYVYAQTWMPALSLIRIEVATGRVDEIRRIDEFSTGGVMANGSSWTPGEEPVVLKDVSSSQIYRIDRDR